MRSYRLQDALGQVLLMHRGARVLSAQVVRGEIQIWALVDITQSNTTFKFDVAWDGHLLSDDVPRKFIATVMFTNGPRHIFQRLSPPEEA